MTVQVPDCPRHRYVAYTTATPRPGHTAHVDPRLDFYDGCGATTPLVVVALDTRSTHRQRIRTERAVRPGSTSRSTPGPPTRATTSGHDHRARPGSSNVSSTHAVYAPNIAIAGNVPSPRSSTDGDRDDDDADHRGADRQPGQCSRHAHVVTYLPSRDGHDAMLTMPRLPQPGSPLAAITRRPVDPTAATTTPRRDAAMTPIQSRSRGRWTVISSPA